MMAAFMRHVFMSNLKCQVVCKATFLRHCRYTQSKSFSDKKYVTPTPVQKTARESADDLDFYGLNETYPETLEQDISNNFNNDLKEINPHEFELQNKKIVNELLQKVPFGWIRHDAKKNVSKTDADGSRQISKSQKKRKRRLTLNKSDEKFEPANSQLVQNISNSQFKSQSEPENHETFMDESNICLEKEAMIPCDISSVAERNNDKDLAYIDSQYFDYDSNDFNVNKPRRNLKKDLDLGPLLNHKESVYGGKHVATVSDESHDKHMSYVDEQYFEHEGNPGENLAYIDSQYFDNDSIEKFNVNKPVRSHEKDHDFGPLLNHEKTVYGDKHVATVNDMSYVDEQYFEYDRKHVDNYTQEEASIPTFADANFDSVSSARFRRKVQNEEISATDNSQDSSFQQEDPSFIDDQYFQNTNEKQQRHVVKSNLSLPEEYNKDMEKQKALIKQKSEKEKYKTLKKASEIEINKGESAYDAAMQLRGKNQMNNKSNTHGLMNPRQYDSLGFRILTGQVPHLQNAPSVDVLKVLRENIIYDDNDIVAINKPYGLASHGGPGILNSVGQLRHEILPQVELHVVHRLDKETTGVMLLGKTAEMTKRLQECFYHKTVMKKYYAITKNIPEMRMGEIDIPIIEGKVEGKARMVLRPYQSSKGDQETKRRQPGKEAVTRYRVLDQADKCALLECIPLTGLKHQIRVHLAFGLNCPILGDHKYSHINKMAPMQLHPGMLENLKIRQSKVRHLAMHLHARSIMIPEFLVGKNLFISAALPVHFVKNMKDLKLKLPPHA